MYIKGNAPRRLLQPKELDMLYIQVKKWVMNEECRNWSDVSMQNTKGWGLGELFVDSR